MKRDKPVRVQLSEEEYELLRDLAGKDHRSLGGYLRAIFLQTINPAETPIESTQPEIN